MGQTQYRQTPHSYMNELVSVIVPVYNVEKYIKRCIDSICAQTYPSLEIIMVDDGSTDHSAVICERCAAIDNRITVIRNKSEGAGVARNTGMDVAHGQYIFFIDSDDYIVDNCIERLISVATQENADIVKCSWMLGTDEAYNLRPEEKPYSVYSNISAFRTRKMNIAVHGKLYKREVIGDLRYPKVTTHDDEFFTYKLIYNAPKIVILDEAYYYFYMTPNSITRGKKERQPLQYIDAYKERISFFEEKREEELVGISHKEFAFRLMYSYINYSKYLVHDMSEEDLLNEFSREYERGIKYAKTPKEMLSLRAFRRFPTIVRALINK